MIAQRRLQSMYLAFRDTMLLQGPNMSQRQTIRERNRDKRKYLTVIHEHVKVRIIKDTRNEDT